MKVLKINTIRRLLIANRGEIAIRIARAATELGIETITVAPADDLNCLHTRSADTCVTLAGRGARAYLDIDEMIEAAKTSGADAIHPGYGFLSESAEFAKACAANGIIFVGPTPDSLSVFGNKASARDLAREIGIATPEGVFEEISCEQAEAFHRGLEAGAQVILKASAGGGGRGIRIVDRPEDVAKAFERCVSEAQASFGHGGVYVERFLPKVRHIEVQVIGDGTGDIVHAWERECTLQRRHQKIVEIAPSPTLAQTARRAITSDAVALAKATKYKGLGTIEFLVWRETSGAWRHAFIEANPRIQVEHTVTEQVTGIDLVKAQLMIADGHTLRKLGLTQNAIPAPKGFAVQLRVNAERMTKKGQVLPSSGRITSFDLPSGPGIRVDTSGYCGYQLSPNYDSLLAKIIVTSRDGDYAGVVLKARRALRELRISGVESNRRFLLALLAREDVIANEVHTVLIDDHMIEIAEAAECLSGDLHFEQQTADLGEKPASASPDLAAPASGQAIAAPLRGCVIAVKVSDGEKVSAGQELLILEAMKMEHAITAPVSGAVTGIRGQVGAVVEQDEVLIWIEAGEVEDLIEEVQVDADPDLLRADLAELLNRKQRTLDEARPDAVQRRRSRNQRTARENIDAICDPGTFLEYGGLVVAAQHSRRSLDDLISKSPADGIVTGIGSVNAEAFGEEASRCVILAYDATVFAGTQGRESHRKDSRMMTLAGEMKLPLIFFTEGGGGRPGDTEKVGEYSSFTQLPRLSGKVPLVGIAAGHCFAGNAAFLGVCDVIIATKTATLGMGGPAMVEGGGLGKFTPEEIGPARMHYQSGVVDILVEDEIEAALTSRKYLSYFQGRVKGWSAHDQRSMRSVVPEERRRAYNMRQVIHTIADVGSVLEIRAGFGTGVITALARAEGRPIGIVANNPMHLGGAIDGDGADKAARFLQLCDAFGLPVLHFCDTPGIMVGPDSEKTALIRRSSRMLAAGANLRVPAFTIITRKAYGLGLVAMMGGAFKTPLFTVAWPTGEYGSMGLEGAVYLGYAKELAAIAKPDERKAYYDQKLAQLYNDGKALQKATSFDFDDVIDPAESRKWLVHGLNSAETMRVASKRQDYPFVSPW